ncbi:MAG: DUF4124 domain-containing protein [Methylococcales bacterium]|nr:DUF4124 domain-containing protein [Methylococcales bacterium]
MRLTLIILGCFVSSSVFSANNVYKCIDAAGKTDYQSSPCGAGLTNSTLNITTGGSTNLDEEKQQQELKQKEEQAKLDAHKLAKQQELEKQASVDKVAIAESENNQSLIKNNPKKYSAFAIPPYVPDKLPDLVKNYRDRLDAVERLRRAAAEKALASNQCGRVESSELDAKSTKTMLTFAVNCSSSKIFSFTEQDLTN